MKFFNKKQNKEQTKVKAVESSTVVSKDEAVYRVERINLWDAIQTKDVQLAKDTIEALNGNNAKINWELLYAPGRTDASILNFAAIKPFSKELFEIVELLVKNGAPKTTDKFNDAPLDAAVKSPSGNENEKFLSLFATKTEKDDIKDEIKEAFDRLARKDKERTL